MAFAERLAFVKQNLQLAEEGAVAEDHFHAETRALHLDGLVPAGLNDQTFLQLSTYITLADWLGLQLILPQSMLEPMHNAGRGIALDWADYYDLQDIKIAGRPVDVLLSADGIPDRQILKIKHLRRIGDGMKFGELRAMFKPDVTIAPNRRLHDLARALIAKHGIKGCVHLRRTDRLIVGNLRDSGLIFNLATQPFNVIAHLKHQKFPPDIYIMSDMPEDDPIIAKMRQSSRYKFQFVYDFPELVRMKQNNNYKLFAMEKCIYEQVAYRADGKRLRDFYCCRGTFSDLKHSWQHKLQDIMYRRQLEKERLEKERLKQEQLEKSQGEQA